MCLISGPKWPKKLIFAPIQHIQLMSSGTSSLKQTAITLDFSPADDPIPTTTYLPILQCAPPDSFRPSLFSDLLTTGSLGRVVLYCPVMTSR